MNDKDDGIVLRGLDGANPLGFMAALGAFRLLSGDGAKVAMRWLLSDGSWRPALHGVGVPLEQLGQELHSAIRNWDQTIWSLDKRLPFEARRLRGHALDSVAQASSNQRAGVDGVASLGVESRADKDGEFKATAFCMVRSGDSAGQGLLAYGKRILDTIMPSELAEAISSLWLYRDKQCALRWDPTEDKGYALQWGDPSKGGALSVKGANAMALLALALFPLIPTKADTETTAFGRAESRQLSFTWPIWEHPLGLDVVGSLLRMPELQVKAPLRSELASRGIAAVYRCDRIMTSTYYANFTPAVRVA